MSVKGSKVNIHLPLEVQYPKDFGKLDDDQLYILCKQKALDLILIENASELFKKLMFETSDKRGLIETLLSEIAIGTDSTVLESIGFDVDEVENLYQFQITKDPKEEKRIKEQLEKTILPTLTYYARLFRGIKTKYVITIFALEHHGEDAHYGAFIYNTKTKKVEIFDSMMAEDSGKMTSGYSRLFHTLAIAISAEDEDVIYPDCIHETYSLQFTGGFPSNYAPYIINAFRRTVLTKKEAFIKNIQSTDSQNHFCYMWSIWYIQMRLMGFSLRDILYKLMQTDSLVVIKRYCYLMVYNLSFRKGKLIDYMPLREFFDSHFPSIWSDLKNPNRDFLRYETVFSKKEGLTMKEVWEESLGGSLKAEESFLKDISQKDMKTLDNVCKGLSFDYFSRGEDRDGLPQWTINVQ